MCHDEVGTFMKDDLVFRVLFGKIGHKNMMFVPFFASWFKMHYCKNRKIYYHLYSGNIYNILAATCCINILQAILKQSCISLS